MKEHKEEINLMNVASGLLQDRRKSFVPRLQVFDIAFQNYDKKFKLAKKPMKY